MKFLKDLFVDCLHIAIISFFMFFTYPKNFAHAEVYQPGSELDSAVGKVNESAEGSGIMGMVEQFVALGFAAAAIASLKFKITDRSKADCPQNNNANYTLRLLQAGGLAYLLGEVKAKSEFKKASKLATDTAFAAKAKEDESTAEGQAANNKQIEAYKTLIKVYDHKIKGIKTKKTLATLAELAYLAALGIEIVKTKTYKGICESTRKSWETAQDTIESQLQAFSGRLTAGMTEITTAQTASCTQTPPPDPNLCFQLEAESQLCTRTQASIEQYKTDKAAYRAAVVTPIATNAMENGIVTDSEAEKSITERFFNLKNIMLFMAVGGMMSGENKKNSKDSKEKRIVKEETFKQKSDRITKIIMNNLTLFPVAQAGFWDAVDEGLAGAGELLSHYKEATGRAWERTKRVASAAGDYVVARGEEFISAREGPSSEAELARLQTIYNEATTNTVRDFGQGSLIYQRTLSDVEAGWHKGDNAEAEAAARERSAEIQGQIDATEEARITSDVKIEMADQRVTRVEDLQPTELVTQANKEAEIARLLEEARAEYARALTSEKSAIEALIGSITNSDALCPTRFQYNEQTLVGCRACGEFAAVRENINTAAEVAVVCCGSDVAGDKPPTGGIYIPERGIVDTKQDVVFEKIKLLGASGIDEFIKPGILNIIETKYYAQYNSIGKSPDQILKDHAAFYQYLNAFEKDYDKKFLNHPEIKSFEKELADFDGSEDQYYKNLFKITDKLFIADAHAMDFMELLGFGLKLYMVFKLTNSFFRTKALIAPKNRMYTYGVISAVNALIILFQGKRLKDNEKQRDIIQKELDKFAQSSAVTTGLTTESSTEDSSSGNDSDDSNDREENQVDRPGNQGSSGNLAATDFNSSDVPSCARSANGTFEPAPCPQPAIPNIGNIPRRAFTRSEASAAPAVTSIPSAISDATNAAVTGLDQSNPRKFQATLDGATRQLAAVKGEVKKLAKELDRTDPRFKRLKNGKKVLANSLSRALARIEKRYKKGTSAAGLSDPAPTGAAKDKVQASFKTFGNSGAASGKLNTKRSNFGGGSSFSTFGSFEDLDKGGVIEDFKAYEGDLDYTTKNDLDIKTEDIIDRPDVSIFKIISTRYLKNYDTLLDDSKDEKK